MSALPPIISAQERLREPRGARVLLLGSSGVGKTWQLRTLPAPSSLFVDIEAGGLSVQDVPVDTLRIADWSQGQDFACRIAGPNPSYPPTAAYSQAHFDAIGGWLPNLERYRTFFIDSITAASRLSFRHAEQLPEAVSERSGRRDIRATYGLHAQQMLAWLNHLQHAQGVNVVFAGILERVVDDLNFVTWQLQCEGNKTSRELPGIVDEIITLEFLNFGDDQPPMRGFVCTSPNPWGFPAKDRSGRLEQIEPPDLGKLLTKLTINRANIGERT
jgi:hypothetical protein